MRKPPNERLSHQARTPAKAGGQDKEKSGPRLSPGNSSAHVPERKCILSGGHAARDELVRLALSPDGEILPDVRAKAPGRGAWIGVDRPALEQALGNGKLRAALARAFKTGDLRIPADLPERIETALRQAALDRLGLEARAATLLTGAEKIETACRKGEVRLLLHADDAADDGSRKLDQAWRVGGGDPQGLAIPAGRAILALALGRQNVVHIALIDRGAAARVRHALDRWRAFIGNEAGLSAATAGTPDATPMESGVDIDEGL